MRCMNRKAILGLFVLVLGLCVGWHGKKLFAQENPLALENSFETVKFYHNKHSDISCKECHHMGDIGQKCTSCHTKDAEIDTQKAFHDNCIICHRDKQKGPVACMDCHKR